MRAATADAAQRRPAAAQTAGAPDARTAARIEALARDAGEALRVLANEPSIGLYHVQEHARRSAPALLQAQRALAERERALALRAAALGDARLALQPLAELDAFASLRSVAARAQRAAERLDGAAP